MSWKPIDTAPKDGTFILAKSPGTFIKGKAFVPAVVAWKNGEWSEVEDVADDDPAVNWDLSEWTDLPPSSDGLPYVNAYDR